MCLVEEKNIKRNESQGTFNADFCPYYVFKIHTFHQNNFFYRWVKGLEKGGKLTTLEFRVGGGGKENI